MEKMVEKTDGDGNTILVPSESSGSEGTAGHSGPRYPGNFVKGQKKFRNKHTNLIPKKKKRKK